MTVYDVATKVLDKELFPQHNIAGLISTITFIVLFSQEKPLQWKEINTHTNTRKPKVMLSTCRKLSCSFAGKNQLHPNGFLEILQRYANFLFWVLWECLVAHTQYDSINLYKTLMFISMPKINVIIHFFFEILDFKESCNFIGSNHFGR